MQFGKGVVQVVIEFHIASALLRSHYHLILGRSCFFHALLFYEYSFCTQYLPVVAESVIYSLFNHHTVDVLFTLFKPTWQRTSR